MPLSRLPRLPAGADARLRPARRLWRHLRESRRELWLLEGRERNSGEPLSASYCGREHLRQDLVRRLFAPGAAQRRLGGFWFWQTRRALREASPACALLAVENPLHEMRPWGVEETLHMPVWAAMEIPLGDGVERLRIYSEASRKMRQNKLEIALARDEQSLRDFHHNMYVPYARSRHQDASILDDYAKVRRDFFHFESELLFLKQGGESLAGGLLRYNAGRVYFYLLGLRDGGQEGLKRGLGGALYLAAIQRARERGFSVLGVGGCRPFLRDGVIEHKARWGARFCPPAGGWSTFSLSFLALTPGLEACLLGNPLIAWDERRYRFCVFFRRLDTTALEELADLRETYCPDGEADLEAVLLGSDQEPPPPALEGKARLRVLRFPPGRAGVLR